MRTQATGEPLFDLDAAWYDLESKRYYARVAALLEKEQVHVGRELAGKLRMTMEDRWRQWRARGIAGAPLELADIHSRIEDAIAGAVIKLPA